MTLNNCGIAWHGKYIMDAENMTITLIPTYQELYDEINANDWKKDFFGKILEKLGWSFAMGVIPTLLKIDPTWQPFPVSIEFTSEPITFSYDNELRVLRGGWPFD